METWENNVTGPQIMPDLDRSKFGVVWMMKIAVVCGFWSKKLAIIYGFSDSHQLTLPHTSYADYLQFIKNKSHKDSLKTLQN